MRAETHNLQLSLQRYTANDLSAIHFEELSHLEHQLECSVEKVRVRKVRILIPYMHNACMHTYVYIYIYAHDHSVVCLYICVLRSAV